ncbi:MAG: hypothetical protein KC933_15945 [Myxococcales bacterium]|nr:hypothetical protein [Myxococcales bacterium]
MRRALPLCLLLTACPQPVRTLGPDAGGDSLDGGANAPDSGALENPLPDGGQQDAGIEACPGSPFCLTLTPSKDRVNVGEEAQVTARLSNPEGRPLRITLCDIEPRTERVPGRPALVLSDITYSLVLDDVTGDLKFQVNDVPPFFLATTFHLDVCVTDVGDGGQELQVTVPIHVRGNIVFSAEYNGVFAVDSGGRPATGVSNTYPRGLLLDQTVTRPTGLRMSSDGTLLVYDDDNPARIHRVALDGIEHRLGTFQHLAADLGAAGTIYYDNLGVYQLWELSDGAVAIADTHTSNTPNPRIMVWNADGTFRRQVLNGDSNQHWYAMAATSEDEWLVAMRDGLEGRVVRVDPNTGITQDPPFTDDYSRRLWAVEPWTDGRVVVAGENLITLITNSNGVRLVTDLPSISATWVAATSFDGKLVVANQHQGEDQNLALISEGGRFERWLRIGSGPVVAPYGVAYLR